MRRLIRQKGTGLYFVRGEWTDDLALAQVFETWEAASQARREHHLRNVELYYSFDTHPTA